MKRLLLFIAAAVLTTFGAQASIVVPGQAFTFVTDEDYPFYGYIMSGAAENGNFANTEWESGFAEIDLAGLNYSPFAALSFRYASCFINNARCRSDQFPLASGVASFTEYVGDNAASTTDYPSHGVGTIGSLNLAGTSTNIGLSYDVTSLYNAAIARGDAAFGVHVTIPGGRFDSAPVNEFVTFDSFALIVSPIPEPSTYILMIAGLCAVGATSRRRRAIFRARLQRNGATR